MKIVRLHETKKVVCPKGDFISIRYLLEKDKMGFTITKTLVRKNDSPGIWHYKNHLEACLCIEGGGTLYNIDTKEKFYIDEWSLYALDKNDKHKFIADKDTVLICVFNPPLKGNETHRKDGSYE